MKTHTVLSIALALAATTSAVSAQGVKVSEAKPGLLQKAKISADSAIALAKARLPKATIAEAEIEEEDGKLIFSFDMKTAGKKGIDEVNVDAMTGKVVGKVVHEEEVDEAKDAKAAKAKPPVKKP